MSIKTIFNKSENLLADSIAFNVVTFLKTLVLFIYALCMMLRGQKNGYLSGNFYIWITMIILCTIIYLIQIMLRERIIAAK